MVEVANAARSTTVDSRIDPVSVVPGRCHGGFQSALAAEPCAYYRYLSATFQSRKITKKLD